jgi:hypothetical protein
MSLIITVQPTTVLIEVGRSAQYLNFDFLLENQYDETLLLQYIEVSVYNQAGDLLHRRFMDHNGRLASIHSLVERQMAAKTTMLLFNPFFAFDLQLEIHELRYCFHCSLTGHEQEVRGEWRVAPQHYANHNPLSLPMTGRVLVWDGHDYYSHHRRFDYLNPFLAQLGVCGNFMRYAYDFVTIDADGKMHSSDGIHNEDWYGFGATVRAAAAGVVVACADGQPDNGQLDPLELQLNPMKLFGNHIITDHGHGEFSMLAHLQCSSLSVAIGEAVSAGQWLAKVGHSGSSRFPHLHFELRNGSGLVAEGLPSSFVIGDSGDGGNSGTGLRHQASTIKARAGALDSGDIVVAW